MLRRTLVSRDSTRQSMKSMQYGYQPDPRKLAPVRNVLQREIFPRVARPTTRAVPDQATFLQAIDVNKYHPVADHAGAFESWEELMFVNRKVLTDRGVPYKTVRLIRDEVDLYKNGVMPNVYDRKESQTFWSQFGNTQHRVLPKLPEKYRPHQLGEEQRPVPDIPALSRQPDWAVAEEKRLAEKRSAKKESAN
jgi:hypothetical protein